MTFTIVHQDKSTQARLGLLQTAHGPIETPFFMPAATKASGKFITTDDYQQLGTQRLGKNQHIKAIIANAFILSCKPGIEVVQKAGGLHKFMNFSGVIFTDCGGFQMSRGMYEGKTNKGILFRNPFNNQKLTLTPQKIMEIELALGSDVAMMLDDMSGYGVSREEAKIAMQNTHRWGKESLEIHNARRALRKQHESTSFSSTQLSSTQLLFGIVQGNFYPELREESAKYICSLDFDGIAIGGVAIGEPMEKMYEAVDAALPFIPTEKPRYVMGLGSPLEILECIGRGIDCFDSVFPTQNARHGTLFTHKGKVYIEQTKYNMDLTPLEKECGCHTCQTYTKAYLHHLSKVEDGCFKRLMSIHNLHFMMKLMEDAKKAIGEDRFSEFKEEFRKRWKNGN